MHPSKTLSGAKWVFSESVPPMMGVFL
jgi:hypothetical protein